MLVRSGYDHESRVLGKFSHIETCELERNGDYAGLDVDKIGGSFASVLIFM